MKTIKETSLKRGMLVRMQFSVTYIQGIVLTADKERFSVFLLGGKSDSIFNFEGEVEFIITSNSEIDLLGE